MSNLAVLCDYIDYVMKEYFAVPAQPAPPRQPTEGGTTAWSEAAKGVSQVTSSVWALRGGKGEEVDNGAEGAARSTLLTCQWWNQ